jgi:protein-tyrosine-phosphatase
MAEALLNHMGKGRFRAFSAGSHPSGEVSPFALDLLVKSGIPIVNLRSKSWDEFSRPGAPVIDFVLTVCNRASAEVCPIWPGQPITAHWGVEDPAAVEGSDELKRRAYFKAYIELQHRIISFSSLSVESLDRLSLQKHLDEIGQSSPMSE